MGYTLIDKDTVTSSTANVDYTIDGTYDEIFFTVTGFKSTVDSRNLGFQFITASEGGYDLPIQSAAWKQHAYAHGSSTGIAYESAWDSDISDKDDTATQFARMCQGGDTSESHSAASGELTLYRPQDTTHYKFYLSVAHSHDAASTAAQELAQLFRTAGYVKDTDAIIGIRFVSCDYSGDQDGNINYGEFAMYGLS